MKTITLNIIKGIPVLIVMAALLFTNSVFGQYKVNSDYPILKITEPTCEYTPKQGTTRIIEQRAQEIAEKMQRRDTPCADFNVTYTGFTPEAQAAFQFAVDIWSYSIESTRTITVSARFETADNPNNLGGASPNGAFPLSIEGGPTYYYPAALAEKLTDSDLTDDPNPPPFGESVDILASFNDTPPRPWYFGTDANPPANQSDFVTVVLHELGHGLGFTGMFAKTIDNDDDNIPDEGRIRVGNPPAPSVYDVFIENGAGEDMLSFPDPSVDLLNEFTSNDLFNYSVEAANGNNGVLLKIFAPNPYQGGSSYSHWDEDTFSQANPNALMTPFLGNGAIHNPGPSTLGFFEDMGWTLCDNALSINDFSLNSVTLSPNPFNDEITIDFTNTANNNAFTIELIDINGRLILSDTSAFTNSYTLTNLEDLNDSLYFVKITNDINGASVIKKLIKK